MTPNKQMGVVNTPHTTCVLGTTHGLKQFSILPSGTDTDCSMLCVPLPTPTPSNQTEGMKAEAAYAKDGTLPDPSSTTNPEFQIVLGLIKDGLARDPTKYTRMAKRCR